MKKYLFLFFNVCVPFALSAHYLPFAEPYMVAGSSEWVYPQSGEVDKNAAPVYFCAAASQTPTTAIAYDDPRFVDWASGWKDVYYGENCADEWRTPHLACGKAGTSVFDIVCLGDGGSITMTFDNAIRDGEGFDFAVFENSFDEKFLELAYVEVSSDGVNFVRFPNLSFMIPGFEDFEYGDPPPIGSTGSESFDARLVYNLASKYSIGKGHPFDLAELKYAYDFAMSAECTFSDEYKNHIIQNYPKLYVQNVRYVRIVDIIGDGRNRDSEGYPICDPCNCVGSAGFDLDAIGVINSAKNSALKPQTITFEPLEPMQYNKVVPVELVAVSDSNLPVRFEIVSGNASIDGNVLTPAAEVGEIVIRAVQDGNDIYAKAYAFQILKITEKQTQAITFSAIPNRTPEDSATIGLEASSSSGLPVGFYLVSGNGDFSGQTLVLNDTSAPQIITVRAYQDGDSDYAQATPVDRSFAIYNPQTFSQWSAANGSVSETDDLNGDGYCAAFDYAFGSETASANPQNLPSMKVQNGVISISWRVRVDSSDVQSVQLKTRVGDSSLWVRRPASSGDLYIENGSVYCNYYFSMAQPKNSIDVRFDISLASGATAVSEPRSFVYAYAYSDWLADNLIGERESAADYCVSSDGMTNLQKYASNLPARQVCSQSQVASFSKSESGAVLTYKFYKYAEVKKTFQWSTDMSNWFDASDSDITVEEVQTDLIYKFTKPIPDGGRCFMRVKIEK